jgi:hypothetical protein
MRYVIHIFWSDDSIPERHCSTGIEEVAHWQAKVISMTEQVKVSVFDTETSERTFYDKLPMPK